MLLEVDDDLIQKQIFNVGYQNNKIIDLAKIVKNVVEQKMGLKDIDIDVSKSNDNRSYHINSNKIERILGFKPVYTIEDAVESLCNAFDSGLLKDSLTDSIYSNVKTMQKLNVE